MRLSKLILIWFGIFMLLWLFIWLPMAQIDKENCMERYYELNISRCDRIAYVPTLNPFKHSTKCFCENNDKIYFNLDEDAEERGGEHGH